MRNHLHRVSEYNDNMSTIDFVNKIGYERCYPKKICCVKQISHITSHVVIFSLEAFFYGIDLFLTFF